MTPRNRVGQIQRPPARPVPEDARRLYVARSGSLISAWWETKPPEIDALNRCPRFRPPDIFHDRVTGETWQVLETFETARIITEPFHQVDIASEWAKSGIDRAIEARRSVVRRQKADPGRGGALRPRASRADAREAEGVT